AAEEAGAFSVVLECMSAGIARRITEEVQIPTIGIGAGVDCDGQVLVINDLLGINDGHVPKHVKAYANLREEARRAVTQFRDDVRQGVFPGPEQTFQ
ncbi:MAG: 3-methyl-2-oxobutanoate hydroxymethyltransferase, partial [Patescibacteria group bacterium]|nr:3-methyl-2-oxobutanoate hydroxymethyltransferase [Patescibacteria group bacterium]